MNTNKLITLLGACLFVSLLINLFMAGVVVSSSISATQKVISDVMAQDRQLRKTLSDTDKAVLKRTVDVNRKKITQLRDDLENLKKDVKLIIQKDPVDEKALDGVLEIEKNKKLALILLMHETRKTAMEQMSPEGQAILSKISRLGFNAGENNKARYH